MLAATYILLWLIVGFLVILALGLTFELRRLRLNGFHSPDTTARQDFAAVIGIDVNTGTHTRIPLDSATILLFLNPTCAICHALLAKIERSSSELTSRLAPVVAVCHGEQALCRDFGPYGAAGVTVLYDSTDEMTISFGVVSYPTAVVVDNRKVLAQGSPRNLSELLEIWNSVKAAAA